MGHTQTIHIEIRSTDTEWSENTREYPSAMANENIRNTTIKGLDWSTTYFFRLFASNVEGRSVPSVTMSLTIGKPILYHTVVNIVVD